MQITNRAGIALACLVGSLTACCFDQAQVFGQVANGRIITAKPIDRARLVKAKKQEIRCLMSMYLAQVLQVCDLSDHQIKRLRLATKGVVEKRTFQWLEQVGTIYSSRIEEDADDREIERLVMQEILLETYDPINGRQQADPVEEEPLWQNTLEKALTNSQRQMLARHQESRAKNRLEVATQYLVNIIDHEYWLMDEQRWKLEQLIEQRIESMLKNRKQVAEDDDLVRQLYALPPKEIQLILDPSQLNSWSRRARICGVTGFKSVGDQGSYWRKLARYQPARTRNRLETAANYLVEAIDHEYRLSDEQRVKFKNMVDQKIASMVARRLVEQRPGVFIDRSLVSQLYRLPPKEIKPLLNPPQLKRWSVCAQWFRPNEFDWAEFEVEGNGN